MSAVKGGVVLSTVFPVGSLPRCCAGEERGELGLLLLPCRLGFESSEEAGTEGCSSAAPSPCPGWRMLQKAFLRHIHPALTQIHSVTGLARCGSGPQGVLAVLAQLVLGLFLGGDSCLPGGA